MPQHELGWNLAGHLKSFDLETAEGVAHQGLTKFPRRQGFTIMLAEIATARQDFSEAVMRWQAALNSYGADAPVKIYVRLARVQQELGQLDDAEAVVSAGLDRFPDNLALMTALASVAFKAKDLSKAVSFCQAVRNLHGDRAPAHIYV